MTIPPDNVIDIADILRREADRHCDSIAFARHQILPGEGGAPALVRLAGLEQDALQVAREFRNAAGTADPEVWKAAGAAYIARLAAGIARVRALLEAERGSQAGGGPPR